MLCLQAPENQTQMGLNNDWMYYSSQDTKTRGGGHQTEVIRTQLLPCLSPHSSGWSRRQLKFHLSHPAMETSRGKTGSPWALLLIFHWAEVGHIPSFQLGTGKQNEITTMNLYSHKLSLAGNEAIFPGFMHGRGQFLNKIEVLWGRKKKGTEWMLNSQPSVSPQGVGSKWGRSPKTNYPFHSTSWSFICACYPRNQ